MLAHASQHNVCKNSLIRENQTWERHDIITHGRVGHDNVPTCHTPLLPVSCSVSWAPGRARWWTTGYGQQGPGAGEKQQDGADNAAVLALAMAVAPA